MRERRPTDELRAEHEVVLGEMRGLVEATARLRSGEGESWLEVGDDLRARLGDLRERLLLHFRKEEEGLFPDVLRVVARGAPRVDVLTHFFGEEADDDLKAHALLRVRMRDLAGLLEEAREAGRLEANARMRLGTLVDLMRDLLERHASKEDRVVFPMIERLLDDSQMAAVWERMEAI